MSIESIYWVITHNCNDSCDHCYNHSGPGERSITREEAEAVVAHFPDEPPLRVILSGGEPLTVRRLTLHCLDLLRAKYGERTQLMVQTNGDLLNPRVLQELLDHGATRIDIASMDRYHQHQGARRDTIEAMFQAAGMAGDDTGALIGKDHLTKHVPSYGFWGANEDFWVGGNWPRGRALKNGLTGGADSRHNFCAVVSGARGFLGGVADAPQELAIQLFYLYPCCPSTKIPLADLRTTSLTDTMAKISGDPMWQRLNEGDPWRMGEHLGVTHDEADARIEALGSVCRYCDEFMVGYLGAEGGVRPVGPDQGMVYPTPEFDLSDFILANR